MSTSNNIAIIAGIAPGFGIELFRTLSKAGYKVIGIARSNLVQKILHMESVTPEQYVHIQCDLTDGSAVKNIVKKIESEHGQIEVLVCNAHKLFIKSFDETGLDDIEAVWKNTCYSAITPANAVIPFMQNRGSGTVIFTGATAAVRGGGMFSAFSSAKFALRGFAQALAREYHSQNIHIVHTVIDGLIWEPQTRERFDTSQENCLDPTQLANAYLNLIKQDRSIWSHEADFRPFCEKF